MPLRIAATVDPNLRSASRMAEKKVRYAVVGLGHIAQVAVLPSFVHARENSELVALVSSDEKKRSELARRYEVAHAGSYDDMERVLADAKVDAVYIALPNVHHRPFTERCAKAGVHVLCEKPMATSVADCKAMIAACDAAKVKLMIAYRLHFEAANLHAIAIAQSGDLGKLRFFSSSFGHQVKSDNIRVEGDLGGGALFDMGIYCVNAARYVFRAEPDEVVAFQTAGDGRFEEVDEATTGILRFSGDRVAQFTSSQGTADVDEFRIVGTKGDLRVEPAYGYVDPLVHHLTIDGNTTTKTFPRGDQFAPELLHFSRCILRDEEPEPNGEEGLADVRILEALVKSAKSGRAVKLEPFERKRRPTLALEERKPPVKKPKLVHAEAPSK